MAQLYRQAERTLAPGDVVTLQDRIELMTVETVHAGAFGLEVGCCWFDADDGLRFRSFPLTQLDLFPKPVPEKPIAVGTEVRLRSRGPVMTVQSLQGRGADAIAACEWTGPTGADRRRIFPRNALVLTMLERFQDMSGREF